MRRMLIAALAVVTTTTQAKADWYLGHYGADTCVPFADIPDEFNGPRLYYGAGIYRTPADLVALARAWKQTPYVVTEDDGKPLPPGMALLTVAGRSIPMFGDLGLCRRVMQIWER